jgi:hypothetical protein
MKAVKKALTAERRRLMKALKSVDAMLRRVDVGRQARVPRVGKRGGNGRRKKTVVEEVAAAPAKRGRPRKKAVDATLDAKRARLQELKDQQAAE